MTKAGTRTSLTRRGVPQIGTISRTAWSGRSRIQQTIITNRFRHLHRSHLLLRLRDLLGVSHGARGKDLSLNSIGSKVVPICGCSLGGVPEGSNIFLTTPSRIGKEKSSQREHGKHGQRRVNNRSLRIICDSNVCGRDDVRDCRSVPAATWPGSSSSNLSVSHARHNRVAG